MAAHTAHGQCRSADAGVRIRQALPVLGRAPRRPLPAGRGRHRAGGQTDTRQRQVQLPRLARAVGRGAAVGGPAGAGTAVRLGRGARMADGVCVAPALGRRRHRPFAGRLRPCGQSGRAAGLARATFCLPVPAQRRPRCLCRTRPAAVAEQTRRADGPPGRSQGRWRARAGTLRARLRRLGCMGRFARQPAPRADPVGSVTTGPRRACAQPTGLDRAGRRRRALPGDGAGPRRDVQRVLDTRRQVRPLDDPCRAARRRGRHAAPGVRHHPPAAPCAGDRRRRAPAVAALTAVERTRLGSPESQQGAEVNAGER